MTRPELSQFFPENTTPDDINRVFLRHPNLYKYITALDAYVDWLEEFLDETEGEKVFQHEGMAPCKLSRDGDKYDCVTCGSSFSEANADPCGLNKYHSNIEEPLCDRCDGKAECEVNKLCHNCHNDLHGM